MEQTFDDFFRHQFAAERNLLGFVLQVYIETIAGAIGENMAVVASRNKAHVSILLVTALMLVAPQMAMRFTDEVNRRATVS